METQTLNIPGYTEVYQEMKATTIKVNRETKGMLDTFKEYEHETYDEVIRKLVYIAEHVPEDDTLSKETVRKIEESRRQIAQGKFYTSEQVRKMLGL